MMNADWFQCQCSFINSFPNSVFSQDIIIHQFFLHNWYKLSLSLICWLENIKALSCCVLKLSFNVFDLVEWKACVSGDDLLVKSVFKKISGNFKFSLDDAVCFSIGFSVEIDYVESFSVFVNDTLDFRILCLCFLTF